MSCCDTGDCHQDKPQEQEEHQHQHGDNCNHPHEEAVEDFSEEEKLRLKQERIARRRNENLQNKKKYLPLLKFLKKNGLKFKMAGTEKETVEYFRMDHFTAFLTEKREAIEGNPQMRELLRNWQQLFIYYDRLQNQPHFKWPQQLAVSKRGPASKFASFTFDSTESAKWKSGLVFLAVVGLVLFPLWPYELKYYLWLLSYYSTILLVGIIIVRWLVYLFCSIFGASIWVFPRLFDNVEILESFRPFYSVSWWEGSSVYSVTTRLIIFGLFVYYGYHIYSDPSIVRENIEITKTIMDDLNDWGISKIKGERNFSQSALTDYSKLLNATEEDNDDEKIVGIFRDEGQHAFFGGVQREREVELSVDNRGGQRGGQDVPGGEVREGAVQQVLHGVAGGVVLLEGGEHGGRGGGAADLGHGGPGELQVHRQVLLQQGQLRHPRLLRPRRPRIHPPQLHARDQRARARGSEDHGGAHADRRTASERGGGWDSGGAGEKREDRHVDGRVCQDQPERRRLLREAGADPAQAVLRGRTLPGAGGAQEGLLQAGERGGAGAEGAGGGERGEAVLLRVILEIDLNISARRAPPS